MVDKASRPSKMQAIAHMCTFIVSKLIEAHKVNLLVGGACFSATICFLMGDNLSAVGVDELAFLQVLRASKS